MKLRNFTLALFSLLSLSMFGLEPSGTLPVMYVNTENGAEIVSKDDYLNATYYLDPMGIEGVEAFGSAAEPLATQIKGRGNYTWRDFDKKPYRLKLDAKAALLGMNKSKHFALMAHADDNCGFLRNPCGFKISELLGMPWTPKQAPLELVLNGDYVGLYFLTEIIRVDKDRVNIDEQEDYATDPEVITGGWLVEIDNYNADPHVTLKEKGTDEDYDIWFTYKSPEALSTEQEDYLIKQMKDINDGMDDGSWVNYVDLDVLARFYVVQEVMDNRESFHGSCYMNKQRGNDQKWLFGPVWDFGCTFSGIKAFIYDDWNFHQVWIKRMCQNTEFMELVKKHWKEFYSTKYQELMTYIIDFATSIREAAKRDAERWPKYGNPNEMEKADWVKSVIKGKCEWLAQQWGGQQQEDPGIPLCAYFIDDTQSPWTTVNAYSWRWSTLLLGNWPGTPMQPVEIDGRPGWVINFTVSTDQGLSDMMIIFNDGNGGAPQHQTPDLTFENGKVYYRAESGLADINAEGSWTVSNTGYGLEVTAQEPATLTVADVLGRVLRVNVPAGTTRLSLAPGVYIIDGKKYICK